MRPEEMDHHLLLPNKHSIWDQPPRTKHSLPLSSITLFLSFVLVSAYTLHLFADTLLHQRQQTLIYILSFSQLPLFSINISLAVGRIRRFLRIRQNPLRDDMLTLATVFAVTSAFVFPIMASDPVRVHKLPPYIEPRGVLITRDVAGTPTLVLSQTPGKYPVETIGIVGEPLVLSQTPSPTPTLAAVAKVGEPMQQAVSGVVGTPTSKGSSNTFSTTINLLPSTPTSTATSTATPVSTSSSNFFTKHSLIPTIPNWAVLVIIISASLILFTLIGLLIWRIKKYHTHNRNPKDIDDDEDIIEAYTKYWRTKRNSGGIVGQGNISSPYDEKWGRSSYI